MRFLSILVVLAGCEGHTSCTPGQSAACACTDGTMGAQTCRSDGSFDPCQCQPTMFPPVGAPDNNNNMTTTGKRVFVTGTGYVSSAVTSACGNAAAAANLGGTWQSWLSTSTVDAIDAVTGNGPWHRLDGQLAFNNHFGLTTQPLVPINIDENGRQVSASTRVWTGTDTGGRHTVGSNGTCADWGHVGADTGSAGFSDQTAAWTFASEDACYNPYHVYCFEL
jgi:hypothetical protein